MKSNTLNDSEIYEDQEIYESGISALSSTSLSIIMNKLASGEREVIYGLSKTSHNQTQKVEVKVDGSPHQLQIFQKNVHKVYSGVIVKNFDRIEHKDYVDAPHIVGQVSQVVIAN